MSTYELVRDAIVNKRLISASNNGYHRELCPHVLGTKNGRQQGLFYQFAGESSSGLEPDGSPNNWRCIPIKTMANVEAYDGTWHTSTNHSRLQTCVDEIDVEVEY